MAVKKISELESAVDVTASDLIQLVDVEDADMASSGTNKKCTAQLLANELGQLASVTATGSSASRKIVDRFADVVNVKDFGAVGDGVTDDTVAIQAALNSAIPSGVVTFGSGKTYRYSTLSIPSGVRIIANNAQFSRISASTNHGIVINSNVEIDQLLVITPGGTSGDRAIKIQGGNVTIGFVSVTAVSEGNSSSLNWAIEIESNPSGSFISRITINQLYCKNFSTAVYAKKSTILSINNAIVEYYKLAFYFRDVARSTFNNITCRYLGAASNGSPGENGLLLESSFASNSTNQLKFSNWYVLDSGEHAYRLGGQLSIRDVWFENCIATRPGSSILSGNTSSGEWSGGCGFKILGGNTTITEYHENIHFNNCGVIDTNITYGTYPTGHGVNNFTPWLIIMAKNVHLNNCWTKAVDQEYCSRNGILFTSVDGLHLNGCSFRDINLVAIKPYLEPVDPEYPGQSLPIKNVIINGGFYEVVTNVSGNGVVFYVSDNITLECDNWVVNGSLFKGGSLAVRIESTGSGGSYSNIEFKFNYVDSIVDNSTYATPIIAGGSSSSIFVDCVGPWRSSAFNPSVLNSSVFKDTLNGEFKIRKAGAWTTL